MLDGPVPEETAHRDMRSEAQHNHDALLRDARAECGTRALNAGREK